MEILEKPQCSDCGGSHIKIKKQIAKNGAKQYGWYCLDCDWWAENPTHWLLRKKVKELALYHGKKMDEIETVRDYSSDTTCRVCGKPCTEDHHWAPKAFKEEFGDDWALWESVQDQLCTLHHRQWHDIVTPHLSKKERANGTPDD